MTDERPENLTTDSWQEWPHNRWAYHHIDEVLHTAVVAPSPKPGAPFAVGEQLAVPGLDAELDELCTDGLLVLRGREVVLESYRNGMTPTSRHLLQSVSKSFTSAVLARYVAEGVIDPAAPVSRYVPDLAASAYGSATVQQTLDMVVAVAYSEEYDDPDSEVQRHDRASGWRALRPGETEGIQAFLASLASSGENGAAFQYCSANTDVLAWVLEEVTGRRLTDLLASDLWAPLGAEHPALVTVDSQGFALASGGICVTLRDLARFGRMVLDDGRATDGTQVVPTSWIEDVRRGGPRDVDLSEFPEGLRATGSYRNQFWLTGDEHGCLFGWGIYGQFVWMNPATDVVVAKQSTLQRADDPEMADRNCRLLDRLSVLAATG
jgi:CubicO group peptidase (beta-lactamase class C family)